MTENQIVTRYDKIDTGKKRRKSKVCISYV